MGQNQREDTLLKAGAVYLLAPAGQGPFQDLVRPDLNWNYVIRAAGRHRITPLLFKAIIDTSAKEKVPPAVFEAMKKTYIACLMGNQRLYLQLAPLLEVFAANSIPVILLKGAALCLNTYSDIALRPFGDVDLLVHKENVPRCQQLIEESGYKVILQNYFPVPDERNDELGCEWTYYKGQTVVELHWDLLDKLAPFNIDIDYFWHEAMEVDVQGQPALVMSPEKQLLHLCLHQFKHHWEHLRDLTDISLVIQKNRDSLNWDEISRAARDQELQHCVFHTLALCHQVLGSPDEGVLEKLDSQSSGILSTSIRSLIGENIFEEHLPRRFWELMLVDGARHKTALAGKILIHPFPRNVEGTDLSSRPSTVTGKTLAAAESFYFYRGLVLKLIKHLIASIRKGPRADI